MARPPAIRLGFFVFFNLLISICSLLTLFYSLTICAPRECYSIQDRLAHLHPKLVAIAGAGSADQTLQSPIASSPSSASMLKHLTLMTWNVRYDGKAQYQNRTWPVQTSPEQLPFSRPNKTYPQNETFGEYPWALRRIPLVSTILLHHPSILTLQEVLPNQLQELKALLAPTYSAIGAGRNDASGTRGEAVPVFYRSDLFELVPSDQGGVGPTGFEHFWLSPTPDQAGSVGWDASQTRMCTHLALRAFGSGQIIHLFSTHFDDQGQLARAESAKLIRRRANDALASTLHHQAGSGEDPLVILMGDFNSPREELAWRSIVAGRYGVPASEAGDAAGLSWLTGKSSLPLLDSALSVPTRFRNPLKVPRSAPKGFLSNLLDRDSSHLPRGAQEQQPRDTSVPFAVMPNIVGPSATFTDWGRKTGRREADDEIDFIFVLASPAVKDTTSDSIGKESQEGTEQQQPHQEQAQFSENQHLARAQSPPLWHIAAYGVLSSWSDGEGGYRMSDHRPVISRLVKM